jgi:hypothetical protein
MTRINYNFCYILIKKDKPFSKISLTVVHEAIQAEIRTFLIQFGELISDLGLHKNVSLKNLLAIKWIDSNGNLLVSKTHTYRSSSFVCFLKI